MEELLMCSVCIERYHETNRHPVLLPRCGHSFCRACVSMLVSGGCIVCPTCRTDQRIDHVERLPTEYTLLAIINAQENNKKETCEIHSVKLSFWCRTCERATCGECLFEDHPTHSHEVIRAAKYINDMKENAQVVAVKFLEALDAREQNFYKIIFNCTKRISFAIRNIGVLRKDMEEARELMKGIKEDESLSAATSLSEAAKFLGLKWNIQDANFNRNKKEEKIKDEIQIEKERAHEEDANKQRELKEAKKALKEKTKEKKLLRKSKTLSSVEMMKEVQKLKDETESSDKEKVSSENDKNEKSKQPESKVESNKEIMKQEENSIKDAKTETEAKPDESIAKDIQIETNNKSEENSNKDTTIDTKLKPEEEKPKGTEAELKSKIEEPKVKEIIKREEITINDIIKRKEQLKKPDPIIHNDEHKSLIKNDKIPDLTLIKPRPRITRIKPVKKVTPPPSPAEEKSQTETLKPIVEKDPETTVEPKKLENEVKEVSNNETTTEISKNNQQNKEAADNELHIKESVDNELHKNEEEEESSSDEEEEDPDLKESEEKGAVASAAQKDPDPLENSKDETKKKDATEDFEIEGKLVDFLQVPGFMLCVEASDGKLASIEWGPQGLHIHCLQFTHVTYDIVIRVGDLLLVVNLA